MEIKLDKEAVSVKPVKVVEKSEKKVAVKSEGPVKRIEGKTLKMGVNQTWVHLFQKNETLPGAKRLGDMEISEFLKKEFPDRHSRVFDAVPTVRSRYNRGLLTQGEKPKTQSNPYNKEAAPVKSPVKSKK